MTVSERYLGALKCRKMAHAMEIELYQLFFEGNGREQPQELRLAKPSAAKLSGKDAAVISRLSRFVSRMDERNKKILVGIARKMAAR